MIKIILLVAIIAVAVGAGYLVRSASSDRTQEQIATINGEPLFESDLPAEVVGEIRSLRNQEYRIKYQAIREAALTRLLKAEAARRKITIDELIRAEADAKVPDPAEAELKAYYDAQKGQLGDKPLEEVMAAVRNSLRKPRVDAKRREYFLQLLDAADVQVMLEAPRVEVAGDPARLRGNPMAPVRIVEFSEFQCPYCRRAQPTINAVVEKYGDKVSHSFRDFPLRDIHPNAQKAAEAARCAADQGKFWEYYKMLFANFGQLSREDLTRYAQAVGLEMPGFEQCVDSGKHAAGIEADLQDGLRAGASSTPTFFINGIAVVGAQPQSAFEEIIDRELAKRRP